MRTSQEIMEIVEKYRSRQGLSMDKLGELTNVSRNSLARYKNGSREFPVNKADKFAKVLGISTAFLLGIKIRSDDILDIFNQLNPERKDSVIDYAKFQLSQQNKE
ncbi:helix-turn-helix domain-containing protein [Apilactobacillus xinyiensis]|uniref:helix-turn-helix domain-containing protein n=1 Tax=Apilactobacillus xinyiensis TaxID=2841032 RepID=UPI00200FB007|nr:helix-turn-helix transcriptional regulator [Apilactobacillus xinyiensis]MCL0319404.1 helix-turn-helix domain-containing protein [Apilactobacillus xinyiensis]